MNSSQCPYPRCGIGDGGTTDGSTCGCKWRRPVVACVCGVVNRTDARYCRGCRRVVDGSGLQSAEQVRPGGVSALGVKGRFRQPPSAAGGLLYAHTQEGTVMQLAARAGAEAHEVGRFSLPAAGFNRGKMVDLEPRGQGELRGWTYLVASPSGVEALMLATGESHIIYEARSSQSVAAIHGESDSLAMRGVAASGTMTAIVVRTETDAQTLIMLPMGKDRPAEPLLTLSGLQVAGPTLCGERLAFCTEQQVGIYDRESGRSVADFPRGFSPTLEADGGELSLAPGCLPLVLEEAGRPSRRLWVAGRRDGRVGILRVDFENRDESKFRELPQGSSLTRQQDGSMCLCTGDLIEIFGFGATKSVSANLRNYMPASLGERLLAWFEYDPYPEKQKIGLAWGERRFRVEFESRDCTSETCCGAYLLAKNLAVCWLDTKAVGNQPGLKAARWTLMEQEQVGR